MPWIHNWTRPGNNAEKPSRRGRRFAVDESANTLIIFALTLPVFVAAMAAAIDYSLAASTRSKMQATADSAALAAAREMQLAQTNSTRIAAVANNVVRSAIQDVKTGVVVDLKAKTVRVNLDKKYVPFVSALSGTNLHASSTAQLSGSLPLCLLGLDPSAPQTVGLEMSAKLTAPGCLVQSNSRSPFGMQSLLLATLKASMICSSGGIVLTVGANYSPRPTTDCPPLPDPLKGRAPPSVGPCDYHNKNVTGLSVTLHPGVYCGGLKLTKGATATLAGGIYIFKDGPLTVDDGASITGTGVAFYFKGNGANLTFDADSTVDLSAPTDGPLAGILIYDDPTGASAPALDPLSGRGALGRLLGTSAPRQHQILSDNARNLLGTIYMPEGEIIIDATKPIADKSAYTVLVVKQLHLYSGPNLILNTDYSATDVPVPLGVGPYSAKIRLTN